MNLSLGLGDLQSHTVYMYFVKNSEKQFVTLSLFFVVKFVSLQQ